MLLVYVKGELKEQWIGFDIETSPKETEINKLKFLLLSGANRISIDAQSFEESDLSYIYRNHNVDDCEKALKCLNDNRPNIINIDIIYGIKNQDTASLKKSIDKALNYKPDELFLYPLYIRECTGLSGQEEIEDFKKYQLYLFA